MAALNNVKYVESEFNARPDTIQVISEADTPWQSGKISRKKFDTNKIK